SEYEPVPGCSKDYSQDGGGSAGSGSACSSPRTLQRTGPDPLAIFSFVSPRVGPPVRSPQLQQRLRAALAASTLLNAPGVILDSREQGVLFPVVHFTDDPDALRSRLHQPTSLLDNTALGPEWILRQGVYREVRQILPERSPGHEAEEGETSSFILIGFKSLDRTCSQVMVDTWKDWTGARSIYLHLPDELGLSRISFYHRETPEDLQLFMYVVLVECRCTGTPDKVSRLLDFTQRLRVERMTGYISVYSPLQYSAALSAVHATVTSPTIVKHTDMSRRLLDHLAGFDSRTRSRSPARPEV
ncbi:hypothetical protein B566_EDAN002062, partial [Ephemera danica]